MNRVVIASFEENVISLLGGIKEFPAEMVVMLVPRQSMEAKKSSNYFDLINIPIEIVKLDDKKDFELHAAWK